MTTRATGTFEIKTWDEQPYTEFDDGRKLARASVTQRFSGDIVGDGAVQLLMCYRADGSADFVGLQRIVGRIGDRSGSFVIQGSGTYEDAEARETWRVVPGSGTDDLAGLRGHGEYAAPHGRTARYSLDYEFDTAD